MYRLPVCFGFQTYENTLFSASLVGDQNNEADICFCFFFKNTYILKFIQTHYHVSSELRTVNVIEFQGYSNLAQGRNNDNAIGVSCMCTPNFHQ